MNYYDEHHQYEKKRPSCCCRLFKGLVVVGIIAGAVVALVLALSGDEGPAALFVQVDPPGKNETQEWNTRGSTNGLDMHILNALEDRWTDIFDQAVQDWDSGSPDALTLTTEKVPHDFDCEPVDGRIKVCNGDYGKTDWQGINRALVRAGFIVSSAAKLNDYHLGFSTRANRQYTMCHELGHAFGLPHTDENYYNLERGDCLDYTVRPVFNLKPGEHNHNLLAQIYGTVDPTDTVEAAETAAQQETTNLRPRQPNKNKDEDDRRLGAPTFDGGPSLDVSLKYFDAAACVELKSCSECSQEMLDVRILHENEHGQACEIQLGDGYSIFVEKLLALPAAV